MKLVYSCIKVANCCTFIICLLLPKRTILSYASPEMLSDESVLGMANTQKVENDLSFGWYLHFKESLAIGHWHFFKISCCKRVVWKYRAKECSGRKI